MGDWLQINGEAIYGTRYWKVCDQEDEHLAFTTKGKTLYAIKLAKPPPRLPSRAPRAGRPDR